MAITETKSTTVTVADAVADKGKIKVEIGRPLTVDESRELRGMLKKAEKEAWSYCSRSHSDWLGRFPARGICPF